MALRHSIDRIRHAVLDRFDRMQIGDHRVEVTIGHDLVKSARHDHRHRHAVALDALAQHLLELVISVVADPGFLVGRDVRRRHLEWRLIPTQSAGKRPIADIAGRALWRMAVAASENAIDQIAAAVEQIGVGPRDAECGCKREDQGRCETEQAVPPLVVCPSIPVRSTAAIQPAAKLIANRRGYCGVIPASLAASRMFS